MVGCRLSVRTQVSFARQLLSTTEYVPSLRERVLGLLIERCLEIDVEIKIDDSGRLVGRGHHPPHSCRLHPLAPATSR